MPHEVMNMSRQGHNESDIPEIRVKTAYNGKVKYLFLDPNVLTLNLLYSNLYQCVQVYITYIDHGMSYQTLMKEMKELVGFMPEQVINHNN